MSKNMSILLIKLWPLRAALASNQTGVKQVNFYTDKKFGVGAIFK